MLNPDYAIRSNSVGEWRKIQTLAKSCDLRSILLSAMSIDRFEFLSTYVDDNVAGYYTKISEFAALAPSAGQSQPLNAFAVR